MPFRCDTCGHQSSKWMGFCPQCLVQDPLTEAGESPRRRSTASPAPVVELADVGADDTDRVRTGIGELDRVLGGGLVAGSVILLGGEPGVGKSTLLLQAAGSLARGGRRVLVVSAEESAHQVALRAERLGMAGPGVSLVTEGDVGRVLARASAEPPDLIVVDSIQTMETEGSGAAGGVAQIRDSAAAFIRYAKESGVPTVLVGHVTKDGAIAGPKILEHMVDVVTYLEGDPDRGLRALRSLKNRFGATHIVGMFEMTAAGMGEVDDPSKAFLADWESTVAGTIAFPAVEGRRSVLVEIQALTDGTPYPQPRRSVRGVDPARVHQILAVLGRHGNVKVSDRDVYVNVVGGWKITEPGCDLPIALAIASSVVDVPLGPVAAWGEVGLAGEVRQVPFEARRREEAARMGLGRVIAPEGNGGLRLQVALVRAGLLPSPKRTAT